MSLSTRLGLLVCLWSLNVLAGPGTARSYGSLPLHFEENRGQFQGGAPFVGRADGSAILIRQGGATIVRGNSAASMRIEGASRSAKMRLENRLEGVSNYYLGARHITNVPHYERVRVDSVRPGIDLVYYGNSRRLEYDFILKPGASPSAIRIRFDGTPKISNEGDLVLTPTDKASGEIRNYRPHAWQDTPQGRRNVECRYTVAASGSVGFRVGDYDRSLPLTIDPILVYSTYLAGTSSDMIAAIAVDGLGSAYVTGSTASTDFPVTSGAKHSVSNLFDVFVTKLNPSGTAVVYSTYIGGTSNNTGTAIAVDGSGNASIAGQTTSSDFPTTTGGATRGGADAFVLRLNNVGTIIFSTYLGGSGNDGATGIALDGTGAIYVTGTTDSSNFPVTAGVLRSTNAGGTDGFVVKYSTGGTVSQSTLIGGSLNDLPVAIVVDPVTLSVAIAGTTYSASFPVTSGALQSTFGGSSDTFLSVLNSSFASLTYSTFLGGSSAEIAAGLARDTSGNFYVTGTTQSSNFPTTASAFQPKPGNSYYTEAFLSKISTTGGLVYSTYLGGSSGEGGAAVAVDSSGSAIVTGYSRSNNFPTTPGAFRTRPAGYVYDSDVFLTQFNTTGDTLIYSTLLGSSGDDAGIGVALDSTGAAYIVGTTTSIIFPVTASAFQAVDPKTTTYNPSSFVSKVDLSSPVQCLPSVNPTSVSMPGRGGTTSFMLTLAAGCPWEAIADSGLTITGPAHGMGANSPIAIPLTVALNTNTSFPLTLAVRIGAATFTVNQANGSCSDPVLSPTSLTWDYHGGIHNLGIGLPVGCLWNLAPGAPWLTISSGAGGSGAGTASLYVAADNFSPRSTTLSVAGVSVPVTQAGSTCTATLSSGTTSFAAVGGSGLASLGVTGTGCNWYAYANVPWIQLALNSASGAGNATVAFTVRANAGTLARSGQIIVADKTVTIGQAAGPVGSVSSYTPSNFAGTVNYGFGGDGGPATSALLRSPSYLLYDPATANMYISDLSSGRVRVVNSAGIINTFAGGGGGTAENVSPTSISISPNALAIGPDGTVYIGDTGRLRQVSGGLISTFAGTGILGFTGDNGPATSAQIGTPAGIAVNAAGEVYFVDSNFSRVRKVSGGVITTYAGGGSSFVDTGSALSTNMSPVAVILGPANSIYVADNQNLRIRKIVPGTPPTISTIAGGGGSTADGVPATSASIRPYSLAMDPSGALYFYDQVSSRLRYVDSAGNINTASQLPSSYYFIFDPSANFYYSVLSSVWQLTPVTSACTFSIPAPAVQPAAGGPLSLSVTTTTGCTWASLSTLPWVTITGGSSGTGSGTVSLTIAANTTTVARNGSIAIGDQTVTISQNGRGSGKVNDLRGIGLSDVVIYDPVSGSEYAGLSNGSGAFSYVGSLFTAGFDTIRFGDWNGDGKGDIIVYNSTTALAYVGLGDGSGHFGSTSLFWPPGVSHVVTGDVNGDGFTDLILYRQSDGTMYTAISNGDGTFNYTYSLISSGYTNIVAGDFNGDGKTDFLFYRKSDGLAYLGLSLGSNLGFSPIPGIGPGMDAVQAGDISGDGLTDALFYSNATGVARLAISSGSVFTLSSQSWSPGFTTVQLLDYNGDGKYDVALYNKNNTLGYLGIGNGTGSFTFGSLFWGAGVDNVLVQDLNGDGKPDVILYNSTNGAAYTGINAGTPATPFSYLYSYWGVGKTLGR